MFAKKTAIFVFCQEGILIWAIPPLSPQPSDSIDILPLKIPFPNSSVPHDLEIFKWITVTPWYFDSCESFYFDVLYTNSKLQRFKIIIKPDLSDSSIHVINMPEVISDKKVTSRLELDEDCPGHYRICDGALVYFWNNPRLWETFTGMTSAPFANIFSRWILVNQVVEDVESLCPASGRYVYCDGNFKIFVVYLF
jgi:hypothetical protein